MKSGYCNKFFSTFIFVLFSTLSLLQPKIDPLFLKGCFAELRPEFQQFSILHGIAALPKITNKLNFNDGSVIGKLIKLLFHQIHNQLVAPGALTRPATYLDPHLLGFLVGTAHKNFPPAQEKQIETLLHQAFQKNAHTKNKNLTHNEIEKFTNEAKKIISLIKQAQQLQLNYSLCEVFSALLYLKIGSQNDLDQYYQGIAESLNIDIQEIFTKPHNKDSQTHYTSLDIATTINTLHLEQTDLENFSSNDFEKIITALVCNESLGNSLPTPVTYRDKTLFENSSYPDCFETTLRNILHALMYDKNTGLFTLEKLREYNIDPELIDPALKTYFSQMIATINPCNPLDAGTQECHDAFSAIVSNRMWLQYGNNFANVCNIRFPFSSYEYQKFLESSQEEVTPHPLRTNCSCLQINERKISCFNEASDFIMYELKPSYKNLIIVLDQLLNLGLFTSSEDTLHTTFWNKNFESLYLEKLCQRLQWKKNEEVITTQSGNKRIRLHISTHFDEKFFIDFFFSPSNDNLFSHGQYELEPEDNAQSSQCVDMKTVFEKSQFLFNACCASNSVITIEELFDLSKKTPNCYQMADAFHFCSFENHTDRLDIIDNLLSNQSEIDPAVTLSQTLFLEQTPLADNFYRNTAITMLNNLPQKSLALFVRNKDVKQKIMLIALLEQNSELLKKITQIENKKASQKIISFNDALTYFIQTKGQKFTLGLLEELAPYTSSSFEFLATTALSNMKQEKAKNEFFAKLCTLLETSTIAQNNKLCIYRMLSSYQPYQNNVFEELKKDYLRSNYSNIKNLNTVSKILLKNNFSYHHLFELASLLLSVAQNTDSLLKGLKLLKILITQDCACNEIKIIVETMLDEQKNNKFINHLQLNEMSKIIRCLIKKHIDLDYCFEMSKKCYEFSPQTKSLFQALLDEKACSTKVLNFAQDLCKRNNCSEAAYLFYCLVQKKFAVVEALNFVSNYKNEIATNRDSTNFVLLLESLIDQELSLETITPVIQEMAIKRNKSALNLFKKLFPKRYGFIEAIRYTVHLQNSLRHMPSSHMSRASSNNIDRLLSASIKNNPNIHIRLKDDITKLIDNNELEAGIVLMNHFVQHATIFIDALPSIEHVIIQCDNNQMPIVMQTLKLLEEIYKKINFQYPCIFNDVLNYFMHVTELGFKKLFDQAGCFFMVDNFYTFILKLIENNIMLDTLTSMLNTVTIPEESNPIKFSEIVTHLVIKGYVPAYQVACNHAEKIFTQPTCINNIKIFLAQFDGQFPNNELFELKQAMLLHSILGKRSSTNDHGQELPPAPKRQACETVESFHS